MKTFSDIQTKLLTTLSDGHYHSGTALGEILEVSRTAVWKQIKQLINLGAPIMSTPKQGYRLLTPIKFLDEQLIRSELSQHFFNKAINFHLLASLSSTNQFLKELPTGQQIEVCAAETQTKGRGRFSRQWHSPFGENIYLSSRWNFNCDLSCLAGLSLIVSLAITATLKELAISEAIKIKWPNDILWHHKKLCGCLIEINAESNSKAEVIIGIGLNVNSAVDKRLLLDKPWSSLCEIKGVHFDRNILIGKLIMQLARHIEQFSLHGFSHFLATWQSLDYLAGKMITVSHPLGVLEGSATGINKFGQLLLLDKNDITHELSAGDTSLQSID